MAEQSDSEKALALAGLVGDPVDPGRPLDQSRSDYWTGDAGPKTRENLMAAGLKPPSDKKSRRPIGLVLSVGVALAVCAAVAVMFMLG